MLNDDILTQLQAYTTVEHGNASLEELRGYHDELYHGYTEAFGMASCAVSRMKAHWFYLIHLFDGADALEKPLRKAREGWEYETVVNQIFACWPK